MGLTRFPHGVSSFGVPQIGSGSIPVTSGNYWWVSSVTGNDGNTGKVPTSAFATLTVALSNCTAANGDVIILLPGHAETVKAAAGINVNISGVTILGLGTGSLRPTITVGTATSATVQISAANITIKNVLFVANLASIVTCLSLTTANDFQLLGCEFRDGSTILNFINILKTGATANTCDGLTIVGNKVYSLAAGYLQFVLLAVASDRFSYCNNDVATLSTSTVGSNVNIATFNITNAIVAGNTYANGGGADISTGIMVVGAGAASNGTICDNRIGGIITTPLLCATTLTMAKNQNYSQKTTVSNGILNPAGA